MFISYPSQFNEYLEIVCSRVKFYHHDPQITLPQISAKWIIPDMNDLENNGQCHKMSLSKRMN